MAPRTQFERRISVVWHVHNSVAVHAVSRAPLNMVLGIIQ